jgi:hypothetical protein
VGEILHPDELVVTAFIFHTELKRTEKEDAAPFREYPTLETGCVFFFCFFCSTDQVGLMKSSPACL